MKAVRLVCATTKSETDFSSHTLLGQSLGLFQTGAIQVSVRCNNTGSNCLGLSAFYNTFLTPEHADEILVFVHDDVYLHDWHLVERLQAALQQFDVVGLAGNTQPDYDEPSWALAWNKQKYPTGWQPQAPFIWCGGAY